MDIYNNEDRNKFILVIFDLNGLKNTNDNYGHLIGDELIKTFATGLTHLSGENIIARFGGDEFVLISFDVDYENLINRLESLKGYFNDNPIIVEHKRIVCSFSYGIVDYPAEAKNFNELIRIADERMYENKRRTKA